jgi:enterochelin esterase family protein
MTLHRTLVQLALSIPLLAAPHGRVEEFSIESKAYGRARKVAVYTPPDYSPQRAEPYALLICFDGMGYYQHEIPVPELLDELSSSGKIPTMIAVLVDTSESRLEDLANNRKFADFLGGELIPRVRSGWHVTTDPGHVIVAGASAGGLGAAYVAFRRPDLFGNVLSQSGAFWRGNESSNDAPYEWLTSQYAAAARKPLRFYIEVGAKETRHAVGIGPVFIEANRRFRDALTAKGYPITYIEVPGADHEPGHWRRQFPEGLLWLTGRWGR